MIKKIAYFIGACTDPHRNLALEEYLTDTVGEDTCILYLWQNRHTVVIGRNQNAWQECRTTELSLDGGTLARRLSGGGAVYHDLGNLNFTFSLREADYDLRRQQSVIVEACRLLGIPAEISGRNDILTNGCKFSGNSFYSHAGCAFHNGTLLVNVDMANLGKYLTPSKTKLESKGVASVRSRVINLTELKPDLTIDAMATAMVKAFESVYGLEAAALCEQDFDADEIERSLMRIAHQILETNKGADNLALVGIVTRGDLLAKRLAEKIEQIEGTNVPLGKLDISFYRDDFATHFAPEVHSTEIDFDMDGKDVVLVDDVLFTGRTIRAALDALSDFGRPSCVQLAVLVDRGHRELPIQADYVGRTINTSREEHVDVLLEERDGKNEVRISRD